MASTFGGRRPPLELDAYVAARDWAGAVTLLRRRLADGGAGDGETRRADLAWLAYAYYHARDYGRAAAANAELASLLPATDDGGDAANADALASQRASCALLAALCDF